MMLLGWRLARLGCVRRVLICQCWKYRLCATAGKYGLDKMRLAIFMFGVWDGYGVEGRICGG